MNQKTWCHNDSIFDGIMDAELCCNILDLTFMPFIREELPDHRFVQDNDPKHMSRGVQAFFKEKNINWWLAAPESPDCSPIENVWEELKFYLETKVEPHHKVELVNVIKMFWERKITALKCRESMDHMIYKAIPAVVEVQGTATRF